MVEYLRTYQPPTHPVCEVNGCIDLVQQRGFCRSHYKTFRKYGHPLGEQIPRKKPSAVPRGSSPDVYFWAKVDKDGHPPIADPALGPCWIWLAGLDDNGYGVFNSRRLGCRSKLAHRVSWFLAGREFAPGLVLDHRCRVHWCVNPGHLREIDSVTNVMIGDTPTAANARKTRCKHDHPFSEANTYHYSGRPNRRACRTCMRTWSRDRSRRMRAAAKLVA